MHSPLIVSDLSVSFRDRTVLSGFDLTAAPGRRIGLVGENGVGKSTLLRAIAGTLPASAHVSGTISAPTLGHLGQEPPFRDDTTIRAAFRGALAPLHHLVSEVERLAAVLETESPSSYAEALERAVAQDAWAADQRAAEAAARLGLGELDPERPVSTLSGGQRTRLALAALMTTRPSCVLLDEPTNHLDDDAIEVLTEFLIGLDGVVLVASHDRVLLDDVCTDLVDLDPSPFGTDGDGGRRFGGGWSEYVAARAAARLRWEETWLVQQEELRELRAAGAMDTSAVAHNRPPSDGDKYIHHFKGAKVERTLARRKRDLARRLEVAEREQVPKPPKPLAFRGPLATSGTGRVVQARDLVVAGRVVVPRLDLEAGAHLLVSGANGSGKSSLLGALSGRLPSRGSLHVAARRVVELEQDPTFPDPLRPAHSVYADLTGLDPSTLRELGLLHPRDHHRPVGVLSVGQRRRLALAIAIAQRPDLLLLDEPTNHLSLTLAEELESALGSSAGTVVVATHDRWLRRGWSGDELRLDRACSSL